MILNDILFDSAFEMQIVNGDFFVGNCLNQQIGCLLQALPGNYKQSPTVGIGISDYLLDNAIDELTRTVRLQFKKDQLRLKKISIGIDQINIDAEREI
jgi:hypothetical protein